MSTMTAAVTVLHHHSRICCIPKPRNRRKEKNDFLFDREPASLQNLRRQDDRTPPHFRADQDPPLVHAADCSCYAPQKDLSRTETSVCVSTQLRSIFHYKQCTTISLFGLMVVKCPDGARSSRTSTLVRGDHVVFRLFHAFR